MNLVSYYDHTPNIQLSTNNYRYLFFLILLIFNKVFAQQCDLTSQELDQFFTTETQLPPKLTSKVEEGCQEIRRAVKEFAKDEPMVCQAIHTTLFKKPFRIACKSNKSMHQEAAHFIPSENTLCFSAELVYETKRLNPDVIKHEFIHVTNSIMHLTRCKESNPLALMAPIYPVTDENIKKYNEALDTGDQRIADFEKLIKKALKLNVLTIDKNHNFIKANVDSKKYKEWSKKEDKLLNYYLSIIPQKSLELPLWVPMNELDYREVIKSGYKDNKPFSKVLYINDIPSFEITGIKKIKQGNTVKYLQLFGPFNYITVLLRAPQIAAKMLIQPAYKNLPDYYKLAEREAFTRQSLTREMEKEFYPEAMAIQEAYFKQCANFPEEENYISSSCSP